LPVTSRRSPITARLYAALHLISRHEQRHTSCRREHNGEDESAIFLAGWGFELDAGDGRSGPSDFAGSHVSIGLATMVTEGVWNVLAMHCDGPALQQLLRFWPLVLVAFGMGLLLITKRDNNMSLSKISADRRAQDHERE
jgi:hypothetical protein